MTEFEQQVTEALVDALTEGAPSAEPAIRFVASQLAPRVAAAIMADRFGMADDIARQRGAALRALRDGT